MSSRKQQNNHTALGEASNAIVDYYNNIAEDYDYSRFENSYGCYIDKQERIVLDKLNINPAHSLDLPCGTGRFLNYADYGCDASANMLKVATRNWPNKTLVCGDAQNLPYENDTFDVVITMHLLMHLDHNSIQRIVKEVHRVLRTNGRWIVDVPSDKRRKLTFHKRDNWHGSSSMSIADMRSMVTDLFDMNSVHGIMMFPVHRIPKILRKSLCNIDYHISQFTPIKEFSSYLIYELWKR